MIARHERALVDEKTKFQTFLKFPWSTRSRANRRIDSQMDSSGANTPDPTSPAPETQTGVGDHEVNLKNFSFLIFPFLNFFCIVSTITCTSINSIHITRRINYGMSVR